MGSEPNVEEKWHNRQGAWPLLQALVTFADYGL